MADNETKVEVMAISILTSRRLREDMSPFFKKYKMAHNCSLLLLHYGENKMKKLFIGAVMAVGTFLSSVSLSFADELLVPTMSYRVGPYAANGTMVANGFVDYFFDVE